MQDQFVDLCFGRGFRSTRHQREARALDDAALDFQIRLGIVGNHHRSSALFMQCHIFLKKSGLFCAFAAAFVALAAKPLDTGLQHVTGLNETPVMQAKARRRPRTQQVARQ